ncbi:MULTISPECIES: BCD family MFS transporter [unclassified Roseitalea]|uniref:BCD family MFS transporter n=1 Tax=unclassified Roseitalea TaxID=2639107 RepID=UPI00273EE4C0|nr:MULTISPECIES: BCD family MFS transporter [unclassified Roseitalea]
MAAMWQNVGPRWLPFADVATEDLPLGRLLRLTLFQISVGMATVLLTGTLNRVMIVELGVPTSLVAAMIAIPVLAAPFRVLIGYRSDTYRSLLGWRRVPYIWLGSMLQFGGLAIMPFALLLLQSQTTGPEWAGPVGAALAFLLTGIGMHMTQTAGLALATDLAAPENRPRVVALAYVMLLVGMIVSALAFGWLLAGFDPLVLIKVVQGAAVATVVINLIALWKQEPRNAELTRHDRQVPSFREAFTGYCKDRRTVRLLIAVALGAAGFSMQDVLLEPYGGEVLGLSVSATTVLTAIWAGGTLVGFALAGHWLARGRNMYRLAGLGALIGVFAFSAVVFAEPLSSPNLFRFGTALIGLGGGLFAVCTMLAAMEVSDATDSGIAIGAWGAVQATALGAGLALGGFIRDGVNMAAEAGMFGAAMTAPAAGYAVVYHIEIGLLFACLIALGPLVGRAWKQDDGKTQSRRFGLAELPG